MDDIASIASFPTICTPISFFQADPQTKYIRKCLSILIFYKLILGLNDFCAKTVCWHLFLLVADVSGLLNAHDFCHSEIARS